MSLPDEIMDSFGPAEPLEYVRSGEGALFVPLIGLTSDQDRFRVNQLDIARVSSAAWRMMEKNWVTDLYFDFYAARPRFHCVIPAGPQDAYAMREDVDGFLGKALEPVRVLTLCLRLVAPGTVIDVDHSTPVLRIGLTNHRAVGPNRYRLYGAVFGEGVVLPAKMRKLGERQEFFPPRVIQSSGPALHLNPASLRAVKRVLKIYHTYRTGAPNLGIEIAIRHFTRGHDVFATRRERLVSLTTAAEIVFGEFRRQRNGPSIASRIAAAYACRRDGGDVEELIRSTVIPVRHAISHGADRRRELDYEGAAEVLLDCLRVGLPPLLALASTVKVASDSETPVEAFHQLLSRSARGDKVAVAALSSLQV